ncbi:hypothetical protein HY639_05485 [Candidatus Woesearchaeota archaeon]|nr:hypothetical protein [Candidatus Woesearchaeota archaeon]
MSSHDITITCRKCRKQSPMRDMRYDTNGKDLICAACLTSPDKPVQKTKKHEDTFIEVPVSKPKQEKVKEEPGKVKYHCIACRYSFMRNADVTVELCPFCSKPTVRRDTAKTAQDFLQDSSDIFE